MPESTNLNWCKEIIEHIHVRTNWKKQYFIENESKLHSLKEYEENATKKQKMEKTKKAKYSHISDSVVVDVQDSIHRISGDNVEYIQNMSKPKVSRNI